MCIYMILYIHMFFYFAAADAAAITSDTNVERKPVLGILTLRSDIIKTNCSLQTSIFCETYFYAKTMR